MLTVNTLCLHALFQRYVGILSMLCGRNVTMDVAKHPSLEVLRFTELMDDTSHNYNKVLYMFTRGLGMILFMRGQNLRDILK